MVASRKEIQKLEDYAYVKKIIITAMKAYRLKIENPCEEDWKKMASVDGGKFCSHCSKNVIDFTNLSDTEILRIMRNASDQVCGRLREDQQDRALIIEHSKKSVGSAFSKITASLLLIGASKASHAHTLKPLVSINISENHYKAIKDQKLINTDSEFFILKGKVLSARTREVLSFANVVIENSAIGTSTDEQGNFELNIPACFKGNKLNIVVSYTGYVTLVFEINVQDGLAKKEILMEVSNTSLSEIVVVSNGVSREKRSIPGGPITVYDDFGNEKRKSIFKRKWWQFWKKNKTDI